MAKRIYNKRLEEFQPPEKKLVTEADAIIKELARKQTDTKINLERQLLEEKHFEKSSPVISITNFQSGECSLSKLKQVISKTTELETWKAAGLSNEDINIYSDFKEGIEILFKKHVNHEKTLLMKKIKVIEETIRTYEETEAQKYLNKPDEENMGARERETDEQKLLKFALGNNKKEKEILPHPMDGLNDLKSELESRINSEILTDGDINKIRKKARKLQQRLETINEKQCPIINKDVIRNNPRGSYLGKSKWDVESQCVDIKPNEKEKVYDCKQQNLYTIKNGNIVRLESVTNFECNGEKISIEDIKRLPKFENYSEGEINNVLYIKNLSKISTENLKCIFIQFCDIVDTSDLEIKIMTGRMKGQAFIKLTDSSIASSVLNKINGLIVNGKPMIVQYGKKT